MFFDTKRHNGESCSLAGNACVFFVFLSIQYFAKACALELTVLVSLHTFIDTCMHESLTRDPIVDVMHLINNTRTSHRQKQTQRSSAFAKEYPR